MAVKYIHEEISHNLTAPKLIVPFLIKHFNPQSVVDVGCGIGTFLRVFIDNGIPNVKGIDGDWVDFSKLHIDSNLIEQTDLEKKIELPAKYDLVLCLEVAEHLSPDSADVLVDNLTSFGDLIIFSAAAVNQGGQNHINEQNISYWQGKFAARSFVFHDVFRNVFWDNDQVDWWYRQNMFLVTRDTVDIRQFGFTPQAGKIQQYIHPEALNFHVKNGSVSKNKVNKILTGEAPLSLYFNLLLKKVKNKIIGK